MIKEILIINHTFTQFHCINENLIFNRIVQLTFDEIFIRIPKDIAKKYGGLSFSPHYSEVNTYYLVIIIYNY